MSTPRDPRDPLPPAAGPEGEVGGADSAAVPGAVANDVPRDAALSALYRQLPAAVPSAETDAAILAAARRAVLARPRSVQRWHYWSVPVAAVASVLLVVTILHRQEGPGSLPAAVEAPYDAAPPVAEAAVEAAAGNAAGNAAEGAVELAGNGAADGAGAAPFAVPPDAMPRQTTGRTTGELAADAARESRDVSVAVPAVVSAPPAAAPVMPAPPAAVAMAPAPYEPRYEPVPADVVAAEKAVSAEAVPDRVSRKNASTGRQAALADRDDAGAAQQMPAPSSGAGFARYLAGMAVLSVADEAMGVRVLRLQSPDLLLLRTRLLADGWQPHKSCAARAGGAYTRGAEQAGWSLPDADGIVTLRVGAGTCPP